MKTCTLMTALLLTLAEVALSQTGFSTIEPLTPVTISEPTKDKPQAKVWTYAEKWWCVLSASNGTKVFRLDGRTWTEILTLNTKSSKPDCLVSADLVHILFYKGASNKSYIYSLKYNKNYSVYELWDARPPGTFISFPEFSNTATIIVDKGGRMWAATNTESNIKVWWSDAPYAKWSSPITIASGTSSGDICALTVIESQKKIGILWSNHNTKRFGFRTHPDNSNPQNWSEDEIPASQSAISNAGGGMADDHLNIKTSGNGTLYCVAKTDYNRPGFPTIILMIRKPNGTWDNAYPVTMQPEGTQPIVLLNEEKRTLKVIYTSKANGGDIMYRESSMNQISFSSAITLMNSDGHSYNYATSTHQNYTNDIVILATNISTNPMQAIGVIAYDNSSENTVPVTLRKLLKAYPNPVSTSTTLYFALQYSGNYILSLYDAKGSKEMTIRTGYAQAGVPISVMLNANHLSEALYFITLKTDVTNEALKIIVQK
ncbi:MAG: T9SS type A sorting domain-containing protein [Bacteroidota bacterium]